LKRRTKQEELLETICWYKCRDLRFEARKAVATKAVATGSRQQRHAFTTPAVIINFLAIIAGQKKKKSCKELRQRKVPDTRTGEKKSVKPLGRPKLSLAFCVL